MSNLRYLSHVLLDVSLNFAPHEAEAYSPDAGPAHDFLCTKSKAKVSFEHRRALYVSSYNLHSLRYERKNCLKREMEQLTLGSGGANMPS